MKLRTNKLGFSAVEIVIVIVILGLIGLVGYTVYSKQQTKPATEEAATTQQKTEQSPTASDVQSAPEIKSTEDLDKAEAVIDSTEPGSSKDEQTLDDEASAF